MSSASTEGALLQYNENAGLKMLNERLSAQLKVKCEALEAERSNHWRTEQKLATVRCIAGKNRLQNRAFLSDFEESERQLRLESIEEILQHLILLNERLSSQLSDRNTALRATTAQLWETEIKLADVRHVAGEYRFQAKAALPEAESGRQQRRLGVESLELPLGDISELKKKFAIQLKGKDDTLRGAKDALWETERKLAAARTHARDYRLENKRLEVEAESMTDRHNRVVEKIMTEVVDNKKTAKEKNDRLWSVEKKLVTARITNGQYRLETKQLKAMVLAGKAKAGQLSLELNNAEKARNAAEEELSNESNAVHDLGLHLHALSTLMSMDESDEQGADGDNGFEDAIVLKPNEAVGDENSIVLEPIEAIEAIANRRRSEQHTMIMALIENDRSSESSTQSSFRCQLRRDDNSSEDYFQNPIKSQSRNPYPTPSLSRSPSLVFQIPPDSRPPSPESWSPPPSTYKTSSSSARSFTFSFQQPTHCKSVYFLKNSISISVYFLKNSISICICNLQV
jgi:hypothetical protein